MKTKTYKVRCIKKLRDEFKVGVEYEVEDYGKSVLLINIGSQGFFLDSRHIGDYFISLKEERLRKLNKLDEGVL